MVNRRLLSAERGKILLETQERECRLVLVRGRRVDCLGHETFPKFVDNLRQFLTGRLDVQRNRHDDGFEWQSLGFLWAPYRFLFGRSDEDLRVFKFWDAQDGVPLGEMEIFAAEVAQWSEQLRELLDRGAGAIESESAIAAESEIDLRLFAECLRDRDVQAFRGVAERHDCLILLCVPDPLSRQYIGREGFLPEPPDLHADGRQNEPNAGLRDTLGSRYYPAYRLHGVYDAMAGRNLWSPSAGSALWREMNTRLGVDLIQTGPLDQSESVVEADNAGNPLDPQPPVLAFEPDGRIRALLNAREMRSYYDAHGIGWPYSKRLADWEEGDF